MKVVLHNAQQGHQAIMQMWSQAKPYLLAGHKLVMTVEKEKRSLPQNAIIHAVIGEIAKQARHVGSKWDAEDWKRLLVDQYSRDAGISDASVLPALDGKGIVQLGLQTRNFTKEQASEFLEWLYAWAAQNGVEINES